MSQPIFSPTGLDGVIANGNAPSWIIQAATIDPPLTDESTTIPLSALNAVDTVKSDCHHDMDDVSFTRTPETRERQRACEKVKVTVKTGESIEGTITAIYDQQALGGEDIINAVYEALPTGGTVYVAVAYGWDSQKTPHATMIVDVYRGTVQMRAKNDKVQGEDFEFTATLAVDLYLEDVTVTGA